jgi:phosphate butyryltransferase
VKENSGDLYGMSSVLDRAAELPRCSVVVASPYDGATIRSLYTAEKLGIVRPIVIGDEKKVREAAGRESIDLTSFTLVHAEDREIIAKAASFIQKKKAEIIMKGIVGTGDFLHVLLDPRWEIRTERILSHVGLFEIPMSKRLFLMSDAGVNILPNFTRKIHIVANAVDAARKLGIKKIRVAMLAAVEKVKLPTMTATLDAFLMRRFSETGFFGNCEIDGPFAFDNAIDPERAKTKGIKSAVAGKANVIIAPNIETGNVIWKSITCLQKGSAAGVVLGGVCPMIVPSRSDDWRTKLLSIKFARLLMGT